MSTTKPVLLINGNPVGQVGGEGGSGGHTIIDSSGSSLTQESGLQFADSHVTNDSTNGKTVVENIKEVLPADYDSTTDEGIIVCDDGEDAVIGPVSDDYVEVVADGVKTNSALFNELFALIDFDKVKGETFLVQELPSGELRAFNLESAKSTEIVFTRTYNTSTQSIVVCLRINSSASAQYNEIATTSGNSISDASSGLPSDGTVIRLYYGNKKAVVDLQTTANRCLYDVENEVTVKQKIDGLIKSINMSATANSSGVIETSLPTSTLVCTYRFGNYLLHPYTSGGVWKFVVCDIDSNTKAIKAIPNAIGTLYVYYIDL